MEKIRLEVRKLEEAVQRSREAEQESADTRQQLVEARDTVRGLEEEVRSLKADLKAQEEFSANFKNETSQLIREIEQVKLERERAVRERDERNAQLYDLEQEVRNLKAQLTSVAVSGNNAGDASAGVAAAGGGAGDQLKKDAVKSIMELIDLNEPALFDPRGYLGMSDVVIFRSSVREMLDASRSGSPSGVLVAMKSIVVTTRNISESIEQYESAAASGQLRRQGSTGGSGMMNEQAEMETVQLLKNQISTHLTDLMGASKNFATGVEQGTQALDVATRELVLDVLAIAQLIHVQAALRTENAQLSASGYGQVQPQSQTTSPNGIGSVSAKPAVSRSNSGNKLAQQPHQTTPQVQYQQPASATSSPPRTRIYTMDELRVLY